MTAPFVPTLVTQRWINKILVENATVVSLVGDRVFPNVSTSDVKLRHVVHAFGGPNNANVVRPMRAPIPMVSLFWDITAWEPGFSQQALEPIMLAVMEELVGADTRGRERRFIDGSRSFQMDADYIGPQVVPLDIAPPGVWAPIRERYQIGIRPNS